MAAPSKPTNVRWTRQSDRNLTLLWDGGAGATKFQIAWQQGGDHRPVVQKWVTTGRSFKIVRMPVNSGARFVVNAWNNSGESSGWSDFTPWFYTPGPAPVGLAAKSTPDGILVSWRRDATYYQHGAQLEIRVDGVVVDTVTLGNGTAGAAPKTYLDTVHGGSVSYRVRGFVGAAGAASRVFSPWSGWVTITHRVPPAAPRDVAPSGLVGVGNVVFSWTHSPRDGSAQTAAEVRYRPVGGSSWTVKTGGADQSLTVTGFDAGEFELQVRTKGLVAEFGEWSPVSVFEVIALPVVTVTSPTAGTHSIGLVSAVWSYAQAQDWAMTAWRAELWQGPALLEQAAGVGAKTSAKFNTRLMNNSDYELRVWVETGGVRSATAVRPFRVEFTKPAKPILIVEWNEQIGAHEVVMAPGVGGDPTVEMDLEFSVDGGHTWVPMGLGLPAQETAMATFEGRSVGSSLFRATAYTALGALDDILVDVVTASGAYWLAPAGSVENPLRIEYGEGAPPSTDVDPARERNVEFYDGRADGVVYAGEHVRGRLSVKAVLIEDDETVASYQAVQALVENPDPAVYARFPTGHVVEGALTGGLTRTKAGVWDVDLSVEVSKWLT